MDRILGIIGCWPLVDYCLMEHCMETGKAFLSLLTLHHLEMQLTTGLSPQLRWQNCTFLHYLISLFFSTLLLHFTFLTFWRVFKKLFYVLWLLVDTVQHFAKQSALQLQTAKMHFLQLCWPVPAAATYFSSNIFWSLYKSFPPWLYHQTWLFPFKNKARYESILHSSILRVCMK